MWNTRAAMPFDPVQVEVPCLRLRIHPDRHCTVVDHRQGGRDVGAFADKNFVAWLQADGGDCEVQRSRAARDRHAMLDAAELGEFVFESVQRLAKVAGDFTAAQRLCDGLDLFLADDGSKTGIIYARSRSCRSRRRGTAPA